IRWTASTASSGAWSWASGIGSPYGPPPGVRATPVTSEGRRPARRRRGVVCWRGAGEGGPSMSAVWLWVRADLRRRWRSWVVLGLLAGISVGLASAAVAGARRTESAAPRFMEVAHVPTAAVLAN